MATESAFFPVMFSMAFYADMKVVSLAKKTQKPPDLTRFMIIKIKRHIYKQRNIYTLLVTQSDFNNSIQRIFYQSKFQ